MSSGRVMSLGCYPQAPSKRDPYRAIRKPGMLVFVRSCAARADEGLGSPLFSAVLFVALLREAII